MAQRTAWDWLPIPPLRPIIFVSYHHDGDQDYYDAFCKRFTDQYDCVRDNSVRWLFESADPVYVMQSICDQHITGSSCTMVLCGRDTPWRKYVDWEIKGTLDKMHGLIGVALPTARRNESGKIIVPDRLCYNIDSGYALWLTWENIMLSNASALKRIIEEAKSRSQSLVVDRKEIMKKNGTPPSEPASSLSLLATLLGRHS